MVFLFAPTVPSEPSPKNTARTVPGASMSSAGVVRQAGAADVVGDADRESAARPVERQLGEDAGDHAGRELLGRQPVPAADDSRQHLERAVEMRLGERRDHVEEQRLAARSRAPSSGRARRSCGTLAGSASSSACAGNGRYSRTCTHADPFAVER